MSLTVAECFRVSNIHLEEGLPIPLSASDFVELLEACAISASAACRTVKLERPGMNIISGKQRISGYAARAPG